MNAPAIDDIIQILGFAILIFAPFSKRRIRARWANVIFVLGSAIGIARALISLAWDLGWFALGGKGSQILEAYLWMVAGLLLGFLFSLIISGQLPSRKQPPNTALEPTPTAS